MKIAMTNIEWTDKTSNPIHLIKPDNSHGGHWCRKVSPGCTNCYSESLNQSKFFSFASQLKFSGDTPENLILDEAVLKSWLSLKTPQKIFTCSMTDMFGEWIPEEWLDRIFGYMAICRNLTFQILTKRALTMKIYLRGAKQRIRFAAIDIGRELNLNPSLYEDFETCQFDWPLPNVWVGVSVENKQAAIERIPPLRHTPAAVRFLSCEPLLEDLGEIFSVDGDVAIAMQNYWKREMMYPGEVIDWVIVGGESGSNARPCKVEWVRSLVEQCADIIPVFVKQLGSNSDVTAFGKGTNIEQFPEDLRVRQFPDFVNPSIEQVFDAECLPR